MNTRKFLVVLAGAGLSLTALALGVAPKAGAASLCSACPCCADACPDGCDRCGTDACPMRADAAPDCAAVTDCPMKAQR